MIAELRAAVLAAFPGIDAPKAAVYRITRAVAERLNLQAVAAPADQARDLAAVEVWPGVPGVTSDPTHGEEVLVAFVGADGAPVVVARGREGGPASIPIRVRHDATNEILFMTRSMGKVRIGPPGLGEIERLPLAKAPHVQAYLKAVEGWAIQVDILLSAVAAASLVVPSPVYAQSVAARASAAPSIDLIPTTRSESA